MATEASSTKKVISNSIIYSISGLLQKCFSFFLLPLYTAYLTTEDYGITNISSSFITTMSFIVAMSLYSAIMRFYVDYKNDSEKLKRFYGTVVVFVLSMSVITVIVMSIFRTLLSKYVFSGIDYYPVIFITLLSLVFFCQHSIYENILRSQQKALKSSVLSISYFLITVLLNIVFVVFYKLGAVGVLLATLIAGFIYTVFFIVDMLRMHAIKFCIDFTILKDALKYSIPILPHNISTILVDLVSKVLIGNTGSLEIVGVYSVAAQFGSISDTLQNYVNQAYTPWLFEKLKARDQTYKQSIRKVVQLLCSILGFMFIGIALFSQDYIFLFLNASYSEAWIYVPFVVLVYTIKMLYYFYVSTLFYYKKASKKIFIATLTGSLVNLFLSSIAIPIWGAYGSLGADALAMIIRVLIVYIMSIRCDDIGLYVTDFIKRIIIIISFIIIGLLPSFLLHVTSFSISNLIYKIFIATLYFTILYFGNKDEINAYIKQLTSKLHR